MFSALYLIKQGGIRNVHQQTLTVFNTHLTVNSRSKFSGNNAESQQTVPVQLTSFIISSLQQCNSRVCIT